MEFIENILLVYLIIGCFCEIISKNGVVEAFHKVHPHLQSKIALTVKQLHRTGYHFQPPMNWINENAVKNRALVALL
ncbi:hypothetical protein E1A91_D08G123800v1 [Gossypium mustelinum]|uniref:Uncharacterized protein n=3 Tax=Gossypium TaxID=3633 RepID=A0A5J5QD36_GOSBA|nr:hypothetical protein ES319_D08G122000v1 [Gossypium barbadense]TYG57273.1 hypothetical protein ES288_D08G129400v1 [Gossypium darwinii]TYI68985.1 hypothetical protein E1A91_D08G123800v1 [Gossypium mustelinum]